ncbi:hypothetical protein RJ45_08675, partial [Photobacterium gaetbulicola]
DPDYHQNVSEARAIAQREYHQQYQRFLLKQAYWKSVLNDPLAPNREEPTELELSAAKADLEWYQKLAA